MDDNEMEQETLYVNPRADSFRDLLTGDIDIIEYLNSGPGSVGGAASSENICDEDIKLSAGNKMDINALLNGNMQQHQQQQQQQQHQQQQQQQQQHEQQQHNGQNPHMSQQTPHHMPMPMLHTTAAGLGRPSGVHPAAIYGQQQHGYHRTSQERPPPYEHHVVRLPDSPPETDSGAGSAGSPSGSEASVQLLCRPINSGSGSEGPYSPEFQQFQRQQHLHHQAHAAALAAAAAAGMHQQQGSVIHPPVGNGLSLAGSSGQIQPPPGVILNVHGLDHLTQAVVNNYLPVQANGRVNGHTNGHLTPGAVDYFAVAAVAAGQGGANASVQPPPTPGGGGQQTSPNGPVSSANYTPYILPSLHNSPYASEGHLQRKRTRTESTTQFVKPEPTSPTAHASEESLFYDESLSGHQAIRFNEFQKEQWHMLCNSNGRELQSLGFAVVADKGFNYSQFDTSFVNQKKNHFQISVHIEVRDPLAPKFVKVPGDGGGLKPISQFQLDFYGVKAEMVSSLVQIKQSQTDRKPIPYEPVTLELPANRVTKVTVARLHFSETTMNNQRKNGRPNPDQKYFYLVASLNAVVQPNEKYMIVAYNSERVIVRASNPGQFDNGDSEVHWQKGQTPNSIFHPGPVGVGTDKPTSALTVTGDISCTGTVYHPSDAKLKQNIQELNCAEALSKVSQLRVVQYEIRPEIAEEWGLKEEERQRVGVIAQELETVIPEAVKENGAYLTVDDNRIFYESAAAVKELCRLTGNLEYKVEEVEKISKKLSKLSHLRRLDSMRSMCSSSTCDGKPSYPGSNVSYSRSSIAIDSPALHRKDKSSEKKGENGTDARGKHRHHHHHHHHHVCRRFSLGDRGLCDNKVIQTTIIVLVAIMAFCLLAMATLYILDWHKRNNAPPVAQLLNGNNGNLGMTTTVRGPSQSSKQGVDFIVRPGPGSVTRTTTAPPIPPSKQYATILPPPDVHPCLKLPCVEFCCPNSNSYYAVVTNNEDRLETNGGTSNSGVGNMEGMKVGDKPTIVLISRTVNGPPVGMSFRDKLFEVLPKFFNAKTTAENHRPYVVAGSVPENRISGDEGNTNGQKELLPKFTILGLNKTIDGQYCLGDGCTEPKRGNFTYYVPISKYMPHIPLEVKFTMKDKEILQYCSKTTGDYCYGFEGSYSTETRGPRSPKNDAESDVYQRHADTWELPVGIYQTSTFRFRVGPSTTLCTLADDEAGATFVEYNLHFYRTCN